MCLIGAPNQTAVVGHRRIHIPKALLVEAKLPPSNDIPQVENIFQPNQGVDTTSDQACTIAKYNSLIESTGDGNICWFITTEDSGRIADKYHRWHNKNRLPRDGCIRTKYILSHGTKPCTKHGYQFDLFKFKQVDQTTAIYMMRRKVSLHENKTRPPIETGPGSMSIAVPPLTWLDISSSNQWPNIRVNEEILSNKKLTSFDDLSVVQPITQGNQRSHSSGTACFTSLSMSNSLHMRSTSTFCNIDHHAGPSGTVGDSFEAYLDINYDYEWYEEYPWK